jgi:hypothetical protein
MIAAFSIYIGGVVVGLLRIDGPLPVKVGLALLWPVGPIAFVATIALLLAASLVAFPWLGMVVVAATHHSWAWSV